MLSGSYVVVTKNYYVASYGSDKSSGSEYNPFKTIKRAQNEARKTAGDVVIYLKIGDKNIDNTEDLTKVLEMVDLSIPQKMMIFRNQKENTVTIPGNILR